MGLSKSKESYNVSTLQAKIDDENAYGSIREDDPNLYSQFNRNERDIDIINKGETKKERIIRFGPEKRKSIPVTRDRVPSNTPVNEADEEILREIVEKVKSGGAVVVTAAKPSGSAEEKEEEERRSSVDENPVAPIQQVIEDFERKIREDSVRRRGSYLGQIYGENDNGGGVEDKVKEEKKDPLEEVNYRSNEGNNLVDEVGQTTKDDEGEQLKEKASLTEDSNENTITVIIEPLSENINLAKDPLEETTITTVVIAPERRMSYRDKAEFFAEDVPRKDSIETQPLGHRQSIKENLIEEFNSNIHGIEENRIEFVHSMLQSDRRLSNSDETPKKDPLDDSETEISTKRKKSDPLDLKNQQIANGQPTDNCFTEIQQIMNRDFDQINNEPSETGTTFSYFEYSTSSTTTEYPLNMVDTQKPKSRYGLKEEKQIPWNTIREIRTDATKLRRTVEEFEGRKDDVQYVYLNEMLLRCLIKLDSVNVGDDGALKQERKDVVEYVQECIRLLDGRAEGDEADIEVSF